MLTLSVLCELFVVVSLGESSALLNFYCFRIYVHHVRHYQLTSDCYIKRNILLLELIDINVELICWNFDAMNIIPHSISFKF